MSLLLKQTKQKHHLLHNFIVASTGVT